MKSTFEKKGGTYTLGADGIYYPNFVSTDEEPHYGKYGMMRKTYLRVLRACFPLSCHFGPNQDRKSTRLNSSHSAKSRMPSSA